MLTPVGGGLSLWIETLGRGEALLCVSGLGYGSWCWHEVRESFRKTHQVVTFDNRGTGRSDKPAGPYSIAGMADDAAAVLDALGIASAHVLGHSMGGYISQTLALRHLHKVRSLTLVGTSPGGPDTLPVPGETQEAWKVNAGLPALEYARRTMPLSFAPGWTQQHPREFEAYLARRVQYPTPAECWRAQYDACVEYVTQGVPAEQITQRALVVHGTADRVVPFENGQLLARRLPNASWLPVEGAGHIPYLEDPPRFAGWLAAHLRGKP